MQQNDAAADDPAAQGEAKGPCPGRVKRWHVTKLGWAKENLAQSRKGLTPA